MDVRKCANCSTMLHGQEPFCRNCGTPAATGTAADKQPVVDYTRRDAAPFQQPTEDSQKWHKPLLVIGVIVVEFVFFVVVAAVGGDSGNMAYSPGSNNSNGRQTSNSSYTSGKNSSSYNPANTSTYYSSQNNDNSSSDNSSSVKGSKGYLIENLNIRSAPNRTAEIRGTHYKGAQIQVLDEESYSTPDGYSTWYRVKVLKYGCDSQNSSSCGKNWERNGSFGWMQGDDEGWMNAKFISLD
jgi:hypothetical protein